MRRGAALRAIGMLLVAASVAGCGVAATPTAESAEPTFVGSAPTAAPTWVPSAEIERLVIVNAYHLDLWERQAPVLESWLQSDERIAVRVAYTVEGNGAAWGFAVDKLPRSAEACWRSYYDASSRMANGLANYGAAIQKALGTHRESDWSDARATIANFEKLRARLPGEYGAQSRAILEAAFRAVSPWCSPSPRASSRAWGRGWAAAQCLPHPPGSCGL